MRLFIRKPTTLIYRYARLMSVESLDIDACSSERHPSPGLGFGMLPAQGRQPHTVLHRLCQFAAQTGRSGEDSPDNWLSVTAARPLVARFPSSRSRLAKAVGVPPYPLDVHTLALGGGFTEPESCLVSDRHEASWVVITKSQFSTSIMKAC